MHNRSLCEQELESIVVNLESGLKARFLPWLQPGPPEEADRRDKEGPRGHTFFMWPTSDCLGTQGPLEFALFLLNAPPRTPGRPVVGHIKKVCPSGRLIAPIGLLRRAWLQPRQKARLQNRFQSNNNRFKLLLPQPSLLQLRLTILTKQGCEECSRGTLLLQ